MRLVFFSERGSSPMGTPFASGVQPSFALKMSASSSSQRCQRLAFKRRLEQHGEHVVAIDGLDHHLVFGAGAVGGPLMTSSTWAGNMLQPFTLNMSSVRPVSVAMRGWRLPQAQVPGTMRVRSWVR